MPAEGWITVPGKGKRYRMADGSLRMMSPDGVTYDLGGTVTQGLQGAVNWLNANQIGVYGSGSPKSGKRGASQPVRTSSDSGTTYTSYGTYIVPGGAEYSIDGGGPTTTMATAPLVTPKDRVQREELQRMSQQYGAGRTYATRLVPTEEEAVAINTPKVPVPQAAVDQAAAFAQAREANPLADVREFAQIDQRSQEYAQRADIQAWMKANPELAKKFLAKQRQGEPQPMRPTDSGLEAAYSGRIQVAPQGADPSGVPFQQGELPAGTPQPLQGGNAAGFQQEMNVGPAPQAPVYQGPAPDRAPAGMAQSQEALSQAFSGQLEVVPQAAAQQSNLNFNSPLPSANLTQAYEDSRKKQLLNNPVLGKYLNAAGAINASWNG
jgi:hypothetical protein